MSAKARVLSALSDNRLWRTVDLCKAAECHRSQIARLVGAGYIRQFAGGLCHVQAAERLGGREDDVILARRYPGGVLSFTGAARRWNMTEGGVARDCMLVPLSSAHEGSDGLCHVMRTGRQDLLQIGVVEEGFFPGITLRVTDPERTLCDLYSARFRYDQEVRNVALVGYLAHFGCDGLGKLEEMRQSLDAACGKAYCQDLEVALTTIGEVVPLLQGGLGHGPR